MPLPTEQFKRLAEKPQKKERPKWLFDFSMKCGILQNWMVNKYGGCKRYGYCKFRGMKGCVARGSA